MDVQSTISVTELKPGDILLMKDKTYDFFRHVVVITQVDQKTEHCQVAHWRGTHYPYALTEMSLPPEEVLQKRNLAFHAFRLKNQTQALQVAELLQKWCLWAIPFDKKRFTKAEKENNEFFDIESDILKDKQPIITNKSLFISLLAERNQQLNQIFKEHYLDVVKYAARRDISPVRPKPETENQTGFHCLQGILVALQVTCARAFVNAENTKWLSNKKIDLFDKTSEALKSDFDLNAFLGAIPAAFQLYAKHACIDVFNYALEKDKENIVSLGVLAPQTAKLPYDFKQQEDKLIIYAYQAGLKKRNNLIKEVILPSVKPESDRTVLNQKL